MRIDRAPDTMKGPELREGNGIVPLIDRAALPTVMVARPR